MPNYYKILGVSSAATQDELRRAYRILARRYHPDVNPGKASEERFKQIAAAYQVLSDPAERRRYDAEFERLFQASFTSSYDRAHRTYRSHQDHASRERTKPDARSRPREEPRNAGGAQGMSARSARPSGVQAQTPPGRKRASTLTDIGSLVGMSRETFRKMRNKVRDATKGRLTGSTTITQVSLIELSLSVADAIRGVRKTVEISDSGGSGKKISVEIPPGVRTGSVVRFRRKEDPSEEVVLLLRIAHHPWITLAQKGVLIDIPITVNEAVSGARIPIPTLDEPVIITVPAGTQSGSELRLKEKGITFRDGSRGDLFVRFLIKIPEAHGAVGLADNAAALEPYYPSAVRKGLPDNLLAGT